MHQGERRYENKVVRKKNLHHVDLLGLQVDISIDREEMAFFHQGQLPA